MPRNLLLLASLVLSGAALWIAWGTVASNPPGTIPAPARVVDTAPLSSPWSMPLDALAEPTAASRVPAPSQVDAAGRLSLIVAGRVISETGTPIGDARVSLRWVGPKIGASRSRTVRKELMTSSSGAFEFRGTERPLSLELYASKEGLLDSETVSATPGEAGVELVLTSCGAVRGRVIVDDASLLDDIELHIDANYRDGDMRRSPPLRPSAVGRFSFLDVCPRNVRLSVVVQGMNLMDIAGIRVERDGSPPDPRLQPVDLRDRIQRLTIELQDEEDRRPMDGTVSLRDSTSSVPIRTRRTEDGTVRFVVPKGSYRVDIQAPGRRRERLSQVDGDRVVRLKRGLPVRLVLDGSLDLPPLPHRLAVGLSAGAAARASVDDAMGSFGDSGEIRLVLSSTGPHALSWYLESGNRSRFLCGGGGQTIEIRDSKDEQTIHLVLEPEVVRSWKDMLQLRPEAK